MIVLALLFAGNAMIVGATERPRLVVGIVVDQMRWDYMYYYENRFDGGGFSRLLGEGFSCGNTMIDYVPTVTACGHSTVFTGATPAITGIAGNNYLIDGVPVSSVQDKSVQGVGTTTSTGQRSPRNLLVTTLGDQLRLATDFRAKVIGVALKDRAAILPSGHSANGAYWFDKKVGRFITSTYYCSELPQWVQRFNEKNSESLHKELWDSPLGITMTFKMAQAAVEAEHLGADEVTDLLTISISSTDMIGHMHGTRSDLAKEAYLQLDRDLSELFSFLDAKVGKDNYLLFLTADHGGTNNYKYSAEHHLPMTAWSSSEARKVANEELKARYGIDNLIKHEMEYSFYLNNEAIDSAGLNRDEVKKVVLATLEQDKGVWMAIDLETVSTATIFQPLKERLIKGYYKGRSGEIFVLLHTSSYCGNADEDGSNHGTWSQSDAHIPLVFMGWGIEHGELQKQVGMADITPTVCALLHIQAPNGSIGHPITAITDR